MLLKRKIAKKVIKTGLKLVLTEKVLKEHKHIRRIVRFMG